MGCQGGTEHKSPLNKGVEPEVTTDADALAVAVATGNATEKWSLAAEASLDWRAGQFSTTNLAGGSMTPIYWETA